MLMLSSLVFTLVLTLVCQVLASYQNNSNLAQDNAPDDDPVCSNLWSRQECGYLGITQDGCHQRQCCWAPTLAPVPWCFQKKHTCKGYVVTLATPTTTGFRIQLGLNGGKQGCSRFGEDIARLLVLVDFETESRIRVRIIDRDHDRYQIPSSSLPNPAESASKILEAMRYEFKYEKDPFTFRIIRKSTGEAVFETKVPAMDSLVYEDQYLEISTTLPDDANIYGLGEVVTSFRRDPRGTRQTMWARDAATPVDENLYGSHPFYLEMRNGTAHGVFLRNSNGMDVVISPAKLTYKVIGGIFDFTFFLGPSPVDVINQYTELIGRPHMPPAWAMGFHQCRYGYENINQVEKVLQRYREEDLPLDGVWIDIDYMENYKDFTFDELRFPTTRMQRLADILAATNQSIVLIVDPGIPVLPGYEPYDSGMEQDVFIKNLAGKPIEGRVWPGQTYFPDFFNTNETWAWWERHLRETKNILGTNVYPWIDMNEPSNFCNGECTKDQQRVQEEPLKKDAEKVNLRYAINNGGRQAPLNEKTLAEDAKHKNGLRMYDTHNLYGHMEAKATYQAMVNILPNTRPFILSRSTFPGTGAYAAHWTGDNWSEWSHLYFSIPGTLSFGLFGIPFTGADICGFIGNTTEELCLRWHQLGALYPFARNHNVIGANPQEPFVWPTSVLPAARQALNIRYSLLSYFYTLFDRAHHKGTPVWQPLFFRYSDDPLTLKIDHQFLLGDGLMVSPALYKGQIQVKAYFPGRGRWFDFWTHKCLVEDDTQRFNVNEPEDRSHRYKYLPATIDTDPVPISIAGGHIIPIQVPRLTVAETRLQPVSLVIALDETGYAKGQVYVDDGRSIINKDSARITWELFGGEKLVSSAVITKDPSAPQGQNFLNRLNHGDQIEKITILGLNFARTGGEVDSDDVFGSDSNAAKAARCRSKEAEVHNTQLLHSQHPMSSLGSNCAQQQPNQPGKVKKILALTVNGEMVPMSDGHHGGPKGQVDEDVGSLTLHGLKMSLFSDWFIEWRLD
ncbi:hypothetical protein BGZ94_000466 [Podila epigama]|nr:hypothetical protein BGZ94_000466 [Podila epigama]